jgi:hypothetical protein
MDNKEFLAFQLMWIVISIGISVTVSLFVPFPYSWVIIIGIFLLMGFYMRNRMAKNVGGGMFGSLSSPFSGNSVNYYCMSCGTKHREASCPRCGSKMKRVG